MTIQADMEARGAGWVIAQFALLAAIASAPRDVLGVWSPALRRVARSAGLGIGATGALIAALAGRTLGPNLTPFPRPKPGAELVQSGVYSVVRHPIYSGLLLLALGWSLVRGSTVALLLTGVLGLLFDRKAHREEQWLAVQFAAYSAYRRRVKKLVPWVY